MAKVSKKKAKKTKKSSGPTHPMKLDGAHLVLGWHVDQSLNPSYWLTAKARMGEQDPSHLVTISPDRMAKHTAIIAQSGSGKSYFLGRLLEELLLKTKSNITILDPNSDFSMLGSVGWEKEPGNCVFDPNTGNGKLYHERKEAEFTKRWAKVASSINVRKGPIEGAGSDYLCAWSELVPEVIFDGMRGADIESLRRLHWFFKKTEDFVKGNVLDPANVAKKLLGDTNAETKPNRDQMTALVMTETKNADMSLEVMEFIEEALSASTVGAMRNTYFAAHNRAMTTQIIAKDASGLASLSKLPGDRCEVFDLPTFPEQYRHLINFSVLDRLWKSRIAQWSDAIETGVDRRVPHFLVIDEAHNVVPAESQSLSQKVVSDQVCKIAAEGRKFGLFLILSTQRPDKVDPRVLSECDNKILMRIGSANLVSECRDLMGLESTPSGMLDRIPKFKQGHGLLAGSWSKDSVIFKAAPRRTKAGGTDLKSEVWARPPKGLKVP